MSQNVGKWRPQPNQKHVTEKLKLNLKWAGLGSLAGWLCSKCVASIVLPVIKSIVKLLSPQEDDPNYIGEMKAIILEDFRIRAQEFLGLKFLMKTVALDPRFKNLKTVDDKIQREAVFADIEHEMKQHLESKEELYKNDEGPTVKKRKIGLDFDEEDEGQADILKRELESYRAEPLLDEDLDALEWWKKRKEKYLNLLRLVR